MFHPWVSGEIPWRRKQQLAAVFLSEIPMEKEPGEGYTPWDIKSDTTKRLTHRKSGSHPLQVCASHVLGEIPASDYLGVSTEWTVLGRSGFSCSRRHDSLPYNLV